MSLHISQCSDTDNFIKNQVKKDYGLSQGKKSQQIFSVTMMLMILQLYCNKNPSKSDETFPSSNRITLLEEIRKRLKQLRPEIVKRGSKEYNLISVAINQLESMSSTDDYRII